MPRFGCQDIKAAAAKRPQLASLETVPWSLPGASELQVTFEIEEEAADALIPPALHPSVPPYAAFNVARFPDSPVGPFAMAQIRVVARAGIRPRGYNVASFVSTAEAAHALAAGWGFGAEVAEVSLVSRHDRIIGQVLRGDDCLLHVELEDPEPVAPGDIPLIQTLNLARSPGDGAALIVQVDPGYEISRAERGRPELPAFDAEGLACGGLHPCDPIVAVAFDADTDLPTLRFAIDPERPAISGTRRLG